jgi:hypothetical protein
MRHLSLSSQCGTTQYEIDQDGVIYGGVALITQFGRTMMIKADRHEPKDRPHITKQDPRPRRARDSNPTHRPNTASADSPEDKSQTAGRQLGETLRPKE